MGRTNNSLPGSGKGVKAHGYFVRGHAMATQGLHMMDVSKLSKACAKAYMQGYEKGTKERKASVGSSATELVVAEWGTERERRWAYLRTQLEMLQTNVGRALEAMDEDVMPSVSFIHGGAITCADARTRLELLDDRRRALVHAQAVDNRERAKIRKAVAEADVVELTGGPFAVQAADGTILGSGNTVKAAVLDARG
jgi:hypothetical protein